MPVGTQLASFLFASNGTNRTHIIKKSIHTSFVTMAELATNLSPIQVSRHETLFYNNSYVLYQRFKRIAANKKPGESNAYVNGNI